MTEKTIAEIRQEFSAEAVRLMNARSSRTAEITALRHPEGDPYLLERLPEHERRKVLAEQKVALAEEDRRRLRHEYHRAHDRYQEAIRERTSFLNRRLFGVEGADSAALLAKAALAGEDELSSLLDVAAQSGNVELGRVAFLAAHRRRLGDLTHRYLTEVDPEAQALYAELSQAPPPETVERQRADGEQLIPAATAERLTPAPPVNL